MTEAASPSSDIDYIRRLSESGARAPLLGGRFMAWWGFLVAAAYVAQHLALNGAIGDGKTIYGIIWGSFGLAGALGQMLLSRSIGGKAGAGSAGNRASRSVWVGAACAIGSMVIGTFVLAQNGGGREAFDWIAPVAFAVYACCLVVMGALAGDRTIVAAGIGAAIMVGLFTAFILHPDRYLLAAAGSAATVMLPGLLLVSREPKAQA